MEEDRLQTDLGIAADIEENEAQTAAQRQPKKRFVGRRQAGAALSTGTQSSTSNSSAIHGNPYSLKSKVVTDAE